MKIYESKITIRELIQDYADKGEEGVTGFAGLLDIRPAYQREFVYKEKQQQAVIESIYKGLPLNTMYWAVKDNKTFEVLDGQQRTLSICAFINNQFPVKLGNVPKARNFANLQDDEQNKILDYTLSIYRCEGTASDKLDWFEVINIAGEKLTKQELLNAIYAGTFIADAKRFLSRSNCPAYVLAGDYLKGSPIRQEYLETALKWISADNKPETYMSEHQHDLNANTLWLYFQEVISWVKLVFPEYRKEMKGLDWGTLYADHSHKQLDSVRLEAEIEALMKDEDVQKKSGIYEYILTGDDKCLNVRAFPDSMKREVYEEQNGICPKCKLATPIEDMEADHITPFSKNGRTTKDNCQMLCMKCNRSKSDK